MENIVSIHLYLLSKKSSLPITGDNYRVRLYDKDLLKDDFLGENTLDGNGHSIISIVESDFRSADSPNEQFPDLYFKVLRDGKEVYKSKVFKNLKIEESHPFPASDGIHFKLGTFLI